MTDPVRLPDKAKAVARVWRAIQEGEHIFVHGDYDTDGVTSSVLVKWALEAYGAKIDVFVSNRMEDGFGPTPATVQKLYDRGARLIISTDCGITSFAACEKASELGIDIIVTDHHNPGSELPNAFALVNPRLDSSLTDLHGLAGVGVAFKMCHALVKYAIKQGVEKKVDLRAGLDLVALGTVADVSPLLGENRSLVKNGLKLLTYRRRVGLIALTEIAHVEGTVTTSDISRRLAPKINAAGRVGDPMISAELLMTNDRSTATRLAYMLERFNRKRRQAERKAYKEVMSLARQEQAYGSRGAMVIVGEGWHPGVIGLMATRVSRHYDCPVIILCYDRTSRELLGSGRSCAQLNILDVLVSCKDLLSSFGGHPMAVGVSMKRENVACFKECFIGAFQGDGVARIPRDNRLYADDELHFSDVNCEFMDQFEALGPFGSANSEPIFFFRKSQVQQVILLGERHCRGSIEDDKGVQMSFVCYSMSDAQFPRGQVSIMASPRRVTIKGYTEIQLFITDVRTYEEL